MARQAAVLLAGETPRYHEVWQDPAAQPETLIFVAIIGRRIVRVIGWPGEWTLQAETWPLSDLRTLALEGSADDWAEAHDGTPLPSRCAWRLTFWDRGNRYACRYPPGRHSRAPRGGTIGPRAGAAHWLEPARP